MAFAKSHHVLRSPKGGWSVKREGSERASRRFDNLMDALVWGRALADRQGTELVVHWPPLVRRKPSVHVIAFPNDLWKVWKSGARRASGRFRTKQEAVEKGRQLSRKLGADLYVHRHDATVEQMISSESASMPRRDAVPARPV